MGSLGDDHSPPLIIRRAPLTNVFNMPETAEADFLFVQPAHTAARRRHRRADIAVERLGRTDGSGISHESQAFEIEFGASLLLDDAFKHLAQLLFALVTHPALAFFVVVKVETTGHGRQP